MSSPQLLTLPEAARLLRISKTKLYLERKAGRFRVLRCGRVVRVDAQDLERYIRAARAASAAQG